MNYYERHLGDYARDAGHLTMVEHGAYTLLLDRLYASEEPIAADRVHRIARALTKEEIAAVDCVLAEFFILIDGAWTNRRASAEIERFKSKQEKAKRSANARWSGSDRNANALPTHSEGNALQAPGSKLQTPEKEKKPARKAKAAGLASFSSWIDSLAEGVEAIPADHAVFKYAERAGIPDEFVGLAWNVFQRKHRKSEKKQKDWPATFRNAIAGNWFGLWYIDDDGAYHLTTAGKQEKLVTKSPKAGT